MNMNALTNKLLAAGYTKYDKIEYIRWNKSWDEFEYTPKFISYMVLEAPCGLLLQDKNFNGGMMSYMGIDWCLENNNAVYACPYKRANCELNHEYLRALTDGRNGFAECAFHFASKAYDYDNSYEKVLDELNAVKVRKRQEFFSKLKWNQAAIGCACIKWDNDKMGWYAEYDPEECARFCSERQVCALTGKRLDGQKGNVFYNLKITAVRHDGSLFDGEETTTIIKGKKVFSEPKPIAICEAYAKKCGHLILRKEKAERYNALFNSQDITIEVLNIRAEYRESRDLLQDLKDVQEGIEVIHESDLKKQQAEAKRERAAKAKEEKMRHRNKKTIDGNKPYQLALDIKI